MFITDKGGFGHMPYFFPAISLTVSIFSNLMSKKKLEIFTAMD
jgi:hypothetical protein